MSKTLAVQGQGVGSGDMTLKSQNSLGPQSLSGSGVPIKGSASVTGSDTLGRGTFSKATNIYQSNNLMLSEGRNSTPNYQGPQGVEFDLN